MNGSKYYKLVLGINRDRFTYFDLMLLFRRIAVSIKLSVSTTSSIKNLNSTSPLNYYPGVVEHKNEAHNHKNKNILKSEKQKREINHNNKKSPHLRVHPFSHLNVEEQHTLRVAFVVGRS